MNVNRTQGPKLTDIAQGLEHDLGKEVGKNLDGAIRLHSGKGKAGNRLQVHTKALNIFSSSRHGHRKEALDVVRSAIKSEYNLGGEEISTLLKKHDVKNDRITFNQLKRIHLELKGNGGPSRQDLDTSKPQSGGRLHGRDRTAELGKLGVGVSMNAEGVRQLEFRRGIGGGSERRGFFKTREALVNDAAVRSGICKDINGMKDASFPARAVASGALDQKLGTNVVAPSEHARIGGQKGYISAKAAGVPCVGNDEIADFRVRIKIGEAKIMPETQKGASDLHVNDYLTNQVDRHKGNVFLDLETGKVSGIDNDLAFGTNNSFPITHYNPKRIVHEGHGFNLGLPKQIDRGTAERVLAMRPEDMSEVMLGATRKNQPFSDEEIAAAQQRLQTLKDHITKGPENGGAILVSEWNDETLARSAASGRPRAFDAPKENCDMLNHMFSGHLGPEDLSVSDQEHEQLHSALNKFGATIPEDLGLSDKEHAKLNRALNEFQ